MSTHLGACLAFAACAGVIVGCSKPTGGSGTAAAPGAPASPSRSNSSLLEVVSESTCTGCPQGEAAVRNPASSALSAAMKFTGVF